jgi:hypothetical protein
MFEMATRNPTNTKVGGGGSTDFVLHKSQQTIFVGIQSKVIDFTEHKLIKYAEIVRDAQQKLVIMAMISDYRNGNIAIAWRRGLPIYLRIQKETNKSPKKSSE